MNVKLIVDVCPWNVRFARELREERFRPREAFAGKDAAALAREIIAMDEVRYREVFKDSAMTRAKLSGLQRNAAVVLGESAHGCSSPRDRA